MALRVQAGQLPGSFLVTKGAFEGVSHLALALHAHSANVVAVREREAALVPSGQTSCRHASGTLLRLPLAPTCMGEELAAEPPVVLLQLFGSILELLLELRFGQPCRPLVSADVPEGVGRVRESLLAVGKETAEAEDALVPGQVEVDVLALVHHVDAAFAAGEPLALLLSAYFAGAS